MTRKAEPEVLPVVTRADLDKFNASHTAVYVPDAFAPLPGGVWVHKIPTAKIDRMRAAAQVDAAGDQGVITEKFAALQLCEALRLGPDEDAAHLYSPGDWERIKEIPPGIRDRLARVSDALLGYDNDERSKLGNYRGGETFAAGASPDSAASPAA